MEYINQIINTTIDSFDFSFCISINILTYLIIKMVDELNGQRKVNIWIKRLIMCCSIIIIGGIYYISGNDIKLIINSSILAPVFWSWIGKPIANKLNIDYCKNIDVE